MLLIVLLFAVTTHQLFMIKISKQYFKIQALYWGLYLYTYFIYSL